MVEEYTSIVRKDVWDIILRLQGNSVVSSRWIYKINNFAHGSIEKFKVRFLARYFSEKDEVEYEKTFSPIARYFSI